MHASSSHQCPLMAPKSSHSSRWSLLPAPSPRPHEMAVCGACLSWNGLCSWRLALDLGGGVFFQCLLD